MSDADKPPREAMTATEVATLLGLSRNELFRLAESAPEFPKPYRPGTLKFYWLRSDVLTYRERSSSNG